MKLAFNLIDCGLGNNGGSNTLIRSAETFQKMGHEVFLISPLNVFTWYKPKVPIIEYIPNDLDWIIATDCRSVISTLHSGINNKAWYIRGHETWLVPESFIKPLYKLDCITKITNSYGLKRKMIELGSKEPIYVVHQGLDLDTWKDLNLRKNNTKTTIGCLFTPEKRKNFKEFYELAKRLPKDKFKFVVLSTFDVSFDFVDEVVIRPNKQKQIEFYSSIDIWFAPTLNEGLHNPPMEASLCGCLVLCGNYKMNGMIYDYAFKDKTAMVYNNIDEAVQMCLNPNYDLVYNMKDFLKKEIGTREDNMIKFINILENSNDSNDS